MKNRFEISTEGMRQMHEARPLWQLVKELVANVWDERDNGATTCRVEVNAASHGLLEIIVEDDGPGFANITDAYTLMAFTKKRTDSSKRGRFNIGEKELIAIAKDAIIETVGITVSFPAEGGRKQRKNDRIKGTKITVHVKGKQTDIQPTIDMLQSFIVPENINYEFSSNYGTIGELPYRKLIASTATTLKTQICDSPTAPLRDTVRKTSVDIYTRPSAKSGALYEMGIYIQDIDCPYDVDVQQKVPMPVNRDMVAKAYLKDIYAEVLNQTADEITEANVSSTWVQAGLEDDRITEETLKVVGDVQIGDDTVLWSSNPLANERAMLAGKTILHPKMLSSVVRTKYRDSGILESASNYGPSVEAYIDAGGELFGEDDARITESMELIKAYTKWVSNLTLGFECDVQWLNNPDSSHLAEYSQSQQCLYFNVAILGENWFTLKPNGRPKEQHTDLILHELAHHNEGFNPHTGGYVDKLSQIGARLAHAAYEGKCWYHTGVAVALKSA